MKSIHWNPKTLKRPAVNGDPLLLPVPCPFKHLLHLW
jgi:hypothetical protein